MKLFVVVSTLLVVARAGVIAPIAVPTIAAAPILAVPVAQHSTQYHSQDALGQYAYGYADDLSAKNEIKSADGQTIGAYSYLDADGKIQNVQYRSDALHGFRVAASNLPVAPAAPEVAPLVQPEPVKDTPEVVEARAQHLEAVREAEEESKKSKNAVEIKSAIPLQPAILSSALPAAVLRSSVPTVAAQIIAAPSFGYSYGISHEGLFAVNSYALHPRTFITAYAAPGPLLAAPILAESVPVKADEAAAGDQQQLPEAPKDLPEVVAARAQHLETVENIKKDIEKEQDETKKE